jgi:hypothetical protein
VINWHTGETRDLPSIDTLGNGGILDLDAVTPTRRLCKPVLRETSLAKTLRVGAWVLQTGARPSLRKCGSGARIRFEPGSRPVLGQDFVGYLQARRVIYRDLRSSARWVRRWPTTSRPFLTIFGRRLVITTGRTGRYTIFQASR